MEQYRICYKDNEEWYSHASWLYMQTLKSAANQLKYIKIILGIVLVVIPFTSMSSEYSFAENIVMYFTAFIPFLIIFGLFVWFLSKARMQKLYAKRFRKKSSMLSIDHEIIFYEDRIEAKTRKSAMSFDYEMVCAIAESAEMFLVIIETGQCLYLGLPKQAEWTMRDQQFPEFLIRKCVNAKEGLQQK